jgi:hypothetical protein
VAIDHYSKWVEAKVVANHKIKTIIRFIEDDITCGFGVPKLMDNGRKWASKLDQLCQNYRKDHQYIAP